MDKSILVSLIILSFIFLGMFAYSIAVTDYYLSKPLNTSYNSSTNNTQYFKYSYTNASLATTSCMLYLNGVAVSENATAATGVNNTVLSNQSFIEGRNTYYVNCSDTQSVNSNPLEFIIDTTAPSYIYADLPIDYYNTSNATILFRVSATDNIGDYYQNGMVKFTLGVNGNNKTAVSYGNNTLVSFTEVFPDGVYTWNITVTDNSSNTLKSSTNTFLVDTTAPVIAGYTYNNINGTANTSGNMVVRFNFTTTDARNAISTSYAYVYSNSSNLKSDKIFGTRVVNGTGNALMEQLDILPSDIVGDGVFSVEIHSNDSLGNDRSGTNQTNFTKTSLYTGWNLIQVQNNQSFMNVSGYSNAITQVSYFNNNNKTYTTYTVGTATNSMNTLTEGDAVYVYSANNVGLLRKWTIDAGNRRNLTLTTGWNTLTAYNNTVQLYDVCKSSLQYTNSTIKVLSYYYNGFYNSQVCSITLAANNNVTIPRGYGYWINVNETTPFYQSKI